MSEDIDFNFPDPTVFSRIFDGQNLPEEALEIEVLQKIDSFAEGSWQRTWDDINTLTEGRIIVLKQEQKELGL